MTANSFFLIFLSRMKSFYLKNFFTNDVTMMIQLKIKCNVYELQVKRGRVMYMVQVKKGLDFTFHMSY